MEHEIIKRRGAAEAGRKYFFTGKPCKFGHVDRRFVSTGACTECNRERSKEYGRILARKAAKTFWYLLHPDDHAAALAYCQALDLQRGHVPSALPAVTSSAAAQAVAPLSAIQETRRQIAQEYGAATMAPRLPPP